MFSIFCLPYSLLLKAAISACNRDRIKKLSTNNKRYFSFCHLVKNILHPLLCESRALNIGDSSQLIGQPPPFLNVHWLL